MAIEGLEREILKELRDDSKKILSIMPTLATKGELKELEKDVNNFKTGIRIFTLIGAGFWGILKFLYKS